MPIYPTDGRQTNDCLLHAPRQLGSASLGDILARRPCELAAAEDMKMEMIDALASSRPIIDDNAESLSELLLLSHLLSNKHQVPKQRLVSLYGL
mmetsp:Transcript_14846/g.41770  ORF Transcript_14846/g.41770 Transcript_14846/m.41770 type:complete len:94 (+) Transcript_14846:266-547(+)